MRPRDADSLEADLERIRRAGVQTVVSTLEPWEAKELGLAAESEQAKRRGLNFLSFPIEDRSTPPNRSEFNAFVEKLAQRLQSGEKIGVHCRGCIGRSTVVTACTLVKLGWTAMDALAAIERARGCSVPDTEAQWEWILEFGAET
jgi:protein-tyrosine phosphatase